MAYVDIEVMLYQLHYLHWGLMYKGDEVNIHKMRDIVKCSHDTFNSKLHRTFDSRSMCLFFAQNIRI